ncbi:MAG: phosphoribosylamine--glycine ligase [Eubacteriales bacterium]|nr:phosphoribosylamine--glycine ligase [Eubacteriales bacterium]
MKILVVGGGGREHAIVWKLSRSPLVDKIYCAPGNGGIAEIAECLPVSAMDIVGMVSAAIENKISLVVVTPDDPLAAGMVDEMEKAGIRAFGPSKIAAEIESSKVFSKKLMKEYGIPTAGFETFASSEKAMEYLENCDFPIVIKADGLALGKGVVIAGDLKEASQAVKEIMTDKTFGEAGNRIVIEEFLKGPEVSVLAFTDGSTVVPMVSSQDHKRAYDGDKGPNTGGMGAFSPSSHYTNEIARYCMTNIYKKTIDAMADIGRKFKGVIYFGLILTKEGPKVLEYNARFGDPETQAVLPRLKTDLAEIFEAVIDERLDEIEIKWSDEPVVCVVIASGGYPKKYQKGYEIHGIQDAGRDGDTVVFHAGTKSENGRLVTSGGRVLGVASTGPDFRTALERAYEGVQKISFTDMYYRKDIGRK